MMKISDNEELSTSVCSICGEYIGGKIDHAECSKVKKEIHGDAHENKNPSKKLSKKQVISAGRHFSKF